MDFYELSSFALSSTDPKNSAKIYFAGDEETFRAQFLETSLNQQEEEK